MKYDSLSLKEKAELFKLFTSNGIKNLNTIKDMYNSFDKGGAMQNSEDIYEGGMIKPATATAEYSQKYVDKLARNTKNLNSIESTTLQNKVMKAKVRDAINSGVKDVLVPTLSVPAAIVGASELSATIPYLSNLHKGFQATKTAAELEKPVLSVYNKALQSSAGLAATAITRPDKRLVQGIKEGDIAGATTAGAEIALETLPFSNLMSDALIKKLYTDKAVKWRENAKTMLKDHIPEIAQETKGYLTNNRKNKAAIAEGNAWLDAWIKHPVTQKKIAEELNYYNSKPMIAGTNMKQELDNLLSHTPNVREYPLSSQIKDLAKGIYTGEYIEPIHKANVGITYGHSLDMSGRNYINDMYKNNPSEAAKTFPRAGAYISRKNNIDYEDRASTVVHEGTHYWTTKPSLEFSNQKMNLEDIHSNSEYGPFTRKYIFADEGVKDRVNYLSKPTEMHARLMEMRKMLGVNPGNKFDDANAKKLINFLEMEADDLPFDLQNFTKIIDKSPEGIKHLMNNTWSIPAVGVGAAALSKEKK